MNFTFAIVVSEFNENITNELLLGALEKFREFGFKEKNISVVHVPGAIEIPLVAKLLAKSGKFNAIVCLGAVIRGETSHYDYVCEQVSQGCQRVMLDYDLPIIFGILTTENEEQAHDRIGGKEGHKGKEAAETAVKMAKILHGMIMQNSRLQMMR